MATRDTYTKVHEDWKDKPDKTTPVFAEDLEHIEQGIKDAADKRALKEIYNDKYMNMQTYENSEIKVTGTGSLVHGAGSCAPNANSYAGGQELKNTGTNSHAEGSWNTINGGQSVHVEGGTGTVSGSDYAHLEGRNNKCSESEAAHLEGASNTATNSNNAHLEGRENKLNGNNEGAHIEGQFNNVYPTGDACKATGIHVEGGSNEGRGNYSHIEGYYNKEYAPTNSYYNYNHLEGSYNELYTKGDTSHIEGYRNKAGSSSKQADSYMHMEGNGNVSYGKASHIEGCGNTEGAENENGSNYCNHVEGGSNVLSGSNSYVHMSGYYNKSNGANIGAVYGYNNILSGEYCFVAGKCNERDNRNQYAFIVGGGTSDSDRKNIHTLDWAGNANYAGDVTNGAGVSMNSLKSAVDNLETVAKGGAIAKVFDTKEDLDTWLAVDGNPDTLSVGQNIYIAATGTPDYWWDGTGLQILETDKVEIESMTYDETMAILNATAEEVA